MHTKKAETTGRQEVFDLVLELLRDAKEDCEVDCGPMALSKIDRAIRLLRRASMDRRRRGSRIVAGEQEMRGSDSFGQVTYIPLGLSEK